MADAEETTEQLLEMNRRYALAAGDRWFVAPPEEPTSACCLLAGEAVGQIEDVGTLASARGHGLARAVTLAALPAAREAGHDVTFLVADADDWPRLMYERLGFEPCGVVHVFRRAPTSGTSP
jgi:GNAT superfamily N-acetyltransferase